MDFRSLIDKLEKIDQQQLVKESIVAADQILSEDLQILKEAYIALMERLNYKVLDQAAKIGDEIERRQFLGNQARKNGYPGLFDPITGKFVDNKGEYAWFGAYKSEVEQMERDGLIPEKARTEALLGMMGKDYDTAYGNSKKIADKDKAIDDANDIMAKGKQSYKPLDLGVTKTNVQEAKRGTLAKSITESFGYTFKELVESITKEEHKRLKDIVNQLKDQKDDTEVAKLLASYDDYVKIRDLIISKIESILTELQKLKAQPLKESREMLREEVYLFGDESTQKISALTLYYDSNNNLVEYSAREFGDDMSDFGTAVGRNITFGYSDNAVAWLKSKYKGTAYADELKKELAATDKAKERSPYLYGAGAVLGNVPWFLSGWGAGVGLVGSGFDFFHRDKHNQETLLNREKELAAQGQSGGNNSSGQKPQSGSAQKPQAGSGQQPQAQTGHIPYNAEVKKIQDMILKKDPKALPKYGADGKLGQETLAAAQRLGIKLPDGMAAGATAGVSVNNGRVTATASAQVNPAIAQELMTKLGAKDPASAVAAFEKLVAQNGGDVAKAFGTLITPTGIAKESIIFSSMTESEHMAYLKNKLTETENKSILLEFGALTRAALEALALSAGRGTEAVLAALKVAIPTIASTGVKIGDDVWKPLAGAAGKFSNGKGAVMDAEQILHFITNTSGLGERVVHGGKAYEKTATGWAEITASGKVGRNVDANLNKQIESTWAKAHGKDPHAPAPRPAEPTPPKPGEAPRPGEVPAPAPGPVPPAPSPTNPSAFRQWVTTHFPRLSKYTEKIIKVGKVPVNLIRNNKFWAFLAALAAFGYIWRGVMDDTPEPEPGPGPGPGPGPKPEDSDQKAEDEKKKEEERKRQIAVYMSQLDGLVKMLQEMFPDDKETADIIAKVNGAKGTSGSDQKADTSKVSGPGWNPNWQGSAGGTYGGSGSSSTSKN